MSNLLSFVPIPASKMLGLTKPLQFLYMLLLLDRPGDVMGKHCVWSMWACLMRETTLLIVIRAIGGLWTILSLVWEMIGGTDMPICTVAWENAQNLVL